MAFFPTSVLDQAVLNEQLKALFAPATASGSIASFTDGGDDIPVSEYECEIVAQQASGTPTPDNPLPITGFSQADITVTDNDQVTNLYTVAFGQTIYGGKLVYKNGQWFIRATHGYVDLSTLTWNTITSSGNLLFFSNGLGSVIKPPVSNLTLANVISDIYSVVTADGASGVDFTDNSVAVTSTKALYIHNSAYTDATTFKTAMTGHQLVYELATPVIIPITSSTRVKTISGVNNIFSNTGDNSVKYFTENADSLAELIKAFI